MAEPLATLLPQAQEGGVSVSCPRPGPSPIPTFPGSWEGLLLPTGSRKQGPEGCWALSTGMCTVYVMATP